MEETIMAAAQHVFDVMASRVGDDELEKIRQAFSMAEEAHRDQKRKTG